MKEFGTHVGYTVIWGRVSKMVRAGVQMCYYLAASSFYVMVVLSGTRIVRVLCIVMATPCYVATCVGVGVAAECARLRLTAPSSASTNRFLIMPKRREVAKSVSASNNDLNRWYSWLLVLESVMGCVVPLSVLVWSTLGRTV